MKRKKTNLKSIKYNRKYILRTFLLSFLLLAVGFGMLKLYVLYNNKRPIRIECKGQTLEESEDIKKKMIPLPWFRLNTTNRL